MHWRSLNNIEFSLLFLFLIRINWFEIRQGKKKQPTKHKLNTLMRILSFYVRKCFFFKESQLFSAFSAFTLDSLNISWYFMEEKKIQLIFRIEKVQDAWIITLFLNFCFAKYFIFGTRSKHYGKQTFKVLLYGYYVYVVQQFTH